jgi:hypothetical protein
VRFFKKANFEDTSEELFMNSVRFRLLPLGLVLVLVIAACAGSPPPEEPAAPAPAPAQPAPESPPAPAPEPSPTPADPREALLASLNDLLARVEEARKHAYDIDGPVYFESETEAAEAGYASAGVEAKTETPEQIEDTINRYTEVAEAFEKVAWDSLPLYAQDRTNEVIEVRDDAFSSGAFELSPERLQVADAQAEEALRLYEEDKDYYGAAWTVFGAIDKYNALALGSQAYKTREQIEFYNFERYDLENFALADDLLYKAVESYDNDDIDEALNASEESLVRYSVIFNAGMKTYAIERRAAADTERRFSLEKKANVAVKDDFATAQDVFNLAETVFQDEQYIEASRLYFQAEFAFAEVAAAAERKRLLAEEAIRKAEESAATSENTARNAEAVVGGAL